MSIKLRRRMLPSGKIELYLDIYSKGKRLRESLSLQLTPDRRENKEILRMAEAIRAQRELQIHSESHGIPSSHKKNINVFVYAKSIYGSKPYRTAGVYKNAFDHLEKFAGSNLTFEKLTPRFCESFKDHLVANLGLNSAGAYFARFKTVVRHAFKEKILSENPTDDISIRKKESLPKYLTIEEVRQLAETECGNEAVRDSFLFSCFTGLRYEDVEALTWNEIIDSAIEFSQKKTDVGERLPLSSQARQLLEKQKGAKASPRLKIQRSKESIFKMPARQTVDKVLKTWAKRAKLSKSLSFHKSRHTFATLALSSGIDIYTTSKLLGHKNISTTSIYAKIIDERKKEAIEKLPIL